MSTHLLDSGLSNLIVTFQVNRPNARNSALRFCSGLRGLAVEMQRVKSAIIQLIAVNVRALLVGVFRTVRLEAHSRFFDVIS
jgi:hypothetical protein